MIRQPPPLPHPHRPLPLWGRVGVGFSDAASVSFRPSVCQNHRHRYRACRCATTPILYALSAAIPPFADSAPSPHPATINPTPALRRVPRKMRPHFSWVPAHRGRELIGGNWGDCSRIANGKLAFLQLPPFPQQNCPLPLWGRDGVGFSDAASVPFRPSVCQNHHHRYRACFFTHLQGISAMSPVADDEPTPHPATINLTPALPRGGREPIGGKTGDRSCIANNKRAFLQLSPFPQQNCPLPLWGRDGVGFSDAASVPFRPSVCQNHHHRYRACFFTHLQGISAMSPVADDKPTPHPATINPTPALPRGGREPIGGNWGDRSCIPPFSGRFCDCGKMANATPTPALPRCGRWRVLQGRESIGGKTGDRSCITNGKLAFLQLPPFPQQNCPLPPWGRDGVGFSDAASVFFRPSVFQNHHHRYRACFFTHLQGISAIRLFADSEPTPHPATINPTPALPRGGRGFFRCCSGFRCPKRNGQHPHPN